MAEREITMMGAEKMQKLGELFAAKLDQYRQEGLFPSASAQIPDIEQASQVYGPLLEKAYNEARLEVGLPPFRILNTDHTGKQ